MIRCLDIHTHHAAPQPYGVISVGAKDFVPIEDQWYSVGVHPWDTLKEPTPQEWLDFEKAIERPEVVAIGECGIDKIKGGLMFLQLKVFQRQIDLSEKLGKPMVIHDVMAHDIVEGLRRDLTLTQPWAVHGFRGKPTVAKMLTDAGIYLSFGENFNEEALRITPPEFILAETDESILTIEEIIGKLSQAANRDMRPLIVSNTASIIKSSH